MIFFPAKHNCVGAGMESGGGRVYPQLIYSKELFRGKGSRGLGIIYKENDHNDGPWSLNWERTEGRIGGSS